MYHRDRRKCARDEKDEQGRNWVFGRNIEAQLSWTLMQWVGCGLQSCDD
jgi:hypothetical protein